MNCRDFLFEFEDRQNLSDTATFHLDGCPDCQKITAQQTVVWQMIDNLGRVEAPKNFDFHLKARIAKASAENFKLRFPPILRYVLPLSAIVLVFSLFVFNTAFLSGDSGVPQVAETNFPAVSAEQESNFAQTSVQQFEVAGDVQIPNIENPSVATTSTVKQFQESINKGTETKLAAIKQSKKASNTASQSFIEDNFTGSRDSALTNSTKKLPFGLDSNKKIEVVPNMSGVETFSAAKILSELGIETFVENGKRKVKAVRHGSVGEISDIKNDDIIEAIDGKNLSDQFASGKRIEGKTITVTRGGAKTEIALRSQPK